MVDDREESLLDLFLQPLERETGVETDGAETDRAIAGDDDDDGDGGGRRGRTRCTGSNGRKFRSLSPKLSNAQQLEY